MKLKLLLAVFAVFGLLVAACGDDTEAGAGDLDELNVAYFLEWPTPNQYEQNEGTYEDELGVPVNWKNFATGVEMSAAMASGDIDIAYSQGLVPFVNAVSAGQDLKMVAIAVSYAENDNCVAATELGATRDNAAEVLAGASVSVPVGTVAHYKMLKSMQYMGVDTDSFDIKNLDPAEGAAAIQGGSVDVSCGWGGGLQRMLEAGNILMTGGEMEEEIGLKVFDVVSVTSEFAENNPGILQQFLEITENANRDWDTNVEGRLPGIIAASGSPDEAATLGSLDTFSFPSTSDQLGDKWFGNDVPVFMNEVADLFVAEGALDSKLDDYKATIDTSFLEAME
jgi:taurine transport system substrate-binding protein